jgi:hypothetical protein
MESGGSVGCDGLARSTTSHLDRTCVLCLAYNGPHSRTVPSAGPEVRAEPLRLKATPDTGAVCPSSVRNSLFQATSSQTEQPPGSANTLLAVGPGSIPSIPSRCGPARSPVPGAGRLRTTRLPVHSCPAHTPPRPPPGELWPIRDPDPVQPGGVYSCLEISLGQMSHPQSTVSIAVAMLLMATRQGLNHRPGCR